MGWPRGVPVNASQSRTIRSSHPVMMVLPSGLNVATLTRSSCWSGCPTGFPVTKFHSRAVLSSLPVRRVDPSGLTATPMPVLR